MEARRLGLQLCPPHINHANHRFRVTYPEGKPKLFMGLNQVRDLTQKSIDTIIKNRPFDSLEDLLIRVDPHQKEARNLIMCGALEGVVTIPQGLDRIKHKHPPGQLQLFSTTKSTEDWGPTQKYKAQLEILGVSLELSPLEQYAEQIQTSGAISTVEAQEMIDERVRVAGLRQTLRRFKTKSNQIMAFFNLEDFEGSLQVLIPPYLYRKYSSALQEIGPFIIEGIIKEDKDRHRISMQAESIFLLGKEKD